MSIKIGNYEIVFRRNLDAIRQDVLDRALINATQGLIQAELDLEHHTRLKELRTDANEAEIKGFDSAIEQDKRSVTNWSAQLEVLKQII